MGDGNHRCGPNPLCPDRMEAKCRAEIGSRSPVQSSTDTPGTSASTPTSSSEDGHDKLLGVDPDYCRRILVRDAKGTIREIVLPKGLDLDRPKRTRTSFTAEQLYRLELEFQRCQYVVGRERTELARQLNLSETQAAKARVSSPICVFVVTAASREETDSSSCSSVTRYRVIRYHVRALPSSRQVAPRYRATQQEGATDGVWPLVWGVEDPAMTYSCADVAERRPHSTGLSFALLSRALTLSWPRLAGQSAAGRGAEGEAGANAEVALRAAISCDLTVPSNQHPTQPQRFHTLYIKAVKVWFQNRRTKQKKDTTKDSDKRSSTSSESLATCNILRLLEQGRLLSGPAPPPNPLLGPPHPTNGSLLGSPGGGSSTSPGISSNTPPSSLPGGTFGLSLPSLGATPPSPRLGVPPPHSLCFSMPLLGGAHHELTSTYGCGSSAFEPYMRLDRKEADLGGKKTVS
eukprot:superscaffoldBa00002755_g15200